MSKNIQKSAFTLPEVLITLGVIGIVAALTLPSIIQKYKEKQTVNQLKRAYSVLSQAFEFAKQENGTVDEWGLGGMFDAQTHITLANNFKRYIKISQDCVGLPTEQVAEKCTDVHPRDNHYASFITNDGALLIFRNWSPNCGAGSKYRRCGQIYIDINAKKPPNKLGYDYFQVWIFNDKLIPAGAEQDYYKFERGCNRTIANPYPGYVGQFGTCAAWVLYNENMDYLHCDGLSWTGAKSCKDIK